MQSASLTCPYCGKTFRYNPAYVRRFGYVNCLECRRRIDMSKALNESQDNISTSFRDVQANTDGEMISFDDVKMSRVEYISKRLESMGMGRSSIEIVFRHPVTNERREAKVGFSWTTFFFGIFVPMYRGDWKWAVIMLLSAIMTSGISWFVFPFFYNKLWIKELVNKGFQVESVMGCEIWDLERRLGLQLEQYRQGR